MEYPAFISKFLASVDRKNNELYIFHREDPQYLIWVKQETPMRFILIEYYDEKLTGEQILAHPSLAEAKTYAKELIESGFDLN